MEEIDNSGGLEFVVAFLADVNINNDAALMDIASVPPSFESEVDAINGDVCMAATVDH